MSASSRLLTITLGLTAVGCGALAYQQYYLLQTARGNIDALEKERSALRDKVARLEKSRTDRPMWSPAPTSAPSGGPVAEASTDSGGPPVTRAEGGAGNRMRAFAESPQAQQFMAMQQKAALDGRYASLFRKLNLSPTDLEKLKSLLVERQTAAMDVMMAARNQGVDVRTSGTEIAQLVRDAQAEVDGSIQDLLGTTGYQQYQDYEHTLPMRGTVNQLEQRLSYSSAPLSSDQAEQLARILADTAPQRSNDQRMTPGGVFYAAAGMGPPGFMGGGTITDDAVARAQGVLSSSQVDALRQLQQEQQAQAQLTQEMRARFRNGTATSSGPVAVPPPPNPGGG
ncbi:MAG TPA: hypothetical protein VFJ90_16645 [Candidatus Didemnitutus sp.]|nr:hypothetical protein [Candidatus Didemnitutus sp.]